MQSGVIRQFYVNLLNSIDDVIYATAQLMILLILLILISTTHTTVSHFVCCPKKGQFEISKFNVNQPNRSNQTIHEPRIFLAKQKQCSRYIVEFIMSWIFRFSTRPKISHRAWDKWIATHQTILRTIPVRLLHFQLCKHFPPSFRSYNFHQPQKYVSNYHEFNQK